MRVNKYHIVLFVMVLCGSCVDPFQPDIKESQEAIVIFGVVTDQPGIHQVSVSVSMPYHEPALVPVPGCVVRVEDELGNLVVYEEGEPGIYEAYLDDEFLDLYKAYSLHVVTMSGDEYQSSYDTLLPCPPIDTLYFEVQSKPTSDPDVTYYGIRFFSDLTGTEDASRNFRWLLEETWEYNSAQIANLYWEGGPLFPVMGDSINTCYMSDSIYGLYSASTKFLAENRLKRNELNFVSNETPRLKLKYSLLVTQQSLSDEIFQFWERMKSQSGEGGDLYETQPSSTTGNIYNSNKPEEKVLGCFYATQQQQKRLMVPSDFDFVIPRFTCELDTVNVLTDIGTLFPYYLYSLDPMGVGPPYLVGPLYCFDCKLKGGTYTKPDYWQ